MTYRTLLTVFCSITLSLGGIYPASAISLRDLFSPEKEQPLPETKTAPNQETQRKQAEFLVRLRKSDPGHHSIAKAVFNKENELGLVLNQSVPLTSVPALSKAMLEQLAKEFPGQDHTVVTYAATNPPMKIGTARLDAKTGEMTYEPSR